VLKAFIHHIKAASQAAGRRWSPDCSAELESEELELHSRIIHLEDRVQRLERWRADLDKGRKP